MHACQGIREVAYFVLRTLIGGSEIVGAHTRYVSRTNFRESPNALYTALQSEISDALAKETTYNYEELRQIYVSRRLSSFKTYSALLLRKRLPADLQPLMDLDHPSGGEIGTLEAEFIDFLTNFKESRVIWLVGPVGVGKSTLLRYVLRCLPESIGSLRDLFPIIVNAASPGQRYPSDEQLLNRALDSIERSVQAIDSWGHDNTDALTAALEKARLDFSTSPSFPETLFRTINALKAAAPRLNVVLAFDNVDQILPNRVRDLCAAARGAYLTTGSAAIVALRPSTQIQQVDTQYERGAFFKYSLRVTPPDLRVVIAKRFKATLPSIKQRVLKLESGLRIQTPDSRIQDLVSAISEQALTTIVQDNFLTGLCNNSVRKALVSFSFFLSNRKLKFQSHFGDILAHWVADFARKDDRTDIPWEHEENVYADDFLSGLMCGPFEYFESTKSPVHNVYVCDPPNAIPDFTVKYRILAYLSFVSRVVLKDELLSWISAQGVSSTVISHAVGALLVDALVVSRETEYEFIEAQYIEISPSGRHYLEVLVESREYLFQAVFDLPLRHAAWDATSSDRNSLRVRFGSIVEFFEEVIATEERDFQTWESLDLLDHARINFESSGLLSQRLQHAVKTIFDNAASSTKKPVRDGIKLYREQYFALENRCQELQVAVSDWLRCQNQEVARRDIQHKQPESSVVPGLGPLRYAFPTTLQPNDQNLLSLNLLVDEPDDFECDDLTVFWIGLGDEGEPLREFGKLTRTAGSGEFNGRITIHNVDKPTAFPDSEVMLFSGGTELGNVLLPGSNNENSA